MTTPLRCLIVDDEKPARERLKKLLAAHPGLAVAGEAADGRSALEAARALSPDVVFLDIEMPELTGLEVAAALAGMPVRVVFVTAYDEHALKAFELSAADYLLKPVVPERLAAAVAKLAAPAPASSKPRPALPPQLAPRLDRLACRVGTRFVIVDLRTVSAIVARDDYAEVVHEDKRTLADETLDDLEARLDPERFLRIHRSALINLDKLAELRREGDRKYVAVLADPFETELPVARERLEGLRRRLGLPT